MRNFCLWLSISLLAVAGAAQDGTTKPSHPPTSKSSTSKTLEGCLTGLNGSYTLGTNSDDVYQLDANGHNLAKYNSQYVRITGLVTPPHAGSSPNNALEQQYAKLKVRTIKKVFDLCQ
jgi:hypothetical protein